MTKMIFFDIDGTLLDHDKKLPQSTKRAIERLQSQDHRVAIATGRGPFMYKSLREELGIQSFISYNGQYVVWEGEPIYTNPISQPLLHEVTLFAGQHRHPIVYMDHETMKKSEHFHAFIEESISTLKVAQPGHDPEYYKGRPIYQCLLFCTEDEEAQYREKFGDLDFIRWHPYSMDILPKGGSKAAGIQKLLDYLKLDRNDVYAFGDYLNDIEMLQYVGHGVAMGNAPDIVKKAAKHVTKDVGEDGIEYGLTMLGLL